ncbi:MAG: Slp family lipoprotein [Gammaproteobacteria bacterium]|nr:Slp family lipoprotein [Gammaproteobacteria bacterium]
MAGESVGLVALAVVCGGLLAACASAVPQGLRGELPDGPEPGVVRAEPHRYIGREVRWGGKILDVRNEPASTDVEVYAWPLSDSGEPRPEDGQSARFIARFDRFLDPAEYAPDKRLTVRGELVEPVTRPVGEYPYRYPVVEVGVHHLWPEYLPPHEPGWFHDPFYDPWWPWRPWGSYRHWPYGWY